MDGKYFENGKVLRRDWKMPRVRSTTGHVQTYKYMEGYNAGPAAHTDRQIGV